MVRCKQKCVENEGSTGVDTARGEMVEKELNAMIASNSTRTPRRRSKFVCTTFLQIPRLCNRTLT
jgi:hypothetical protein